VTEALRTWDDARLDPTAANTFFDAKATDITHRTMQIFSAESLSGYDIKIARQIAQCVSRSIQQVAGDLNLTLQVNGEAFLNKTKRPLTLDALEDYPCCTEVIQNNWPGTRRANKASPLVNLLATVVLTKVSTTLLIGSTSKPSLDGPVQEVHILQRRVR
jgi:hypothetical protein